MKDRHFGNIPNRRATTYLLLQYHHHQIGAASQRESGLIFLVINGKCNSHNAAEETRESIHTHKERKRKIRENAEIQCTVTEFTSVCSNDTTAC